MRRLLIALIAAGLLAAACTDAEPDELPLADQVDYAAPDAAADDEPDGEPEPDEDDGPAEDDAEEDDRGSDYLFDQEQLHTFELNLSEDDLAFLDGDPTAEEYVDGTLTFEGETIPVGIRYKGSVGAFIRCVEGEFLQRDGEKTCTKLSLKVKVNWENPDDELLGVRKLQFHSMNNDGSQMHERLGYWLFQEMGVPAPRSTHARVLVNGEFVGVFALVENIDGRFTRAHFEDGTGNLYKEVWPFNAEGEVSSEALFIAALRTNERDPDVTASMIREFAAELLDADDPIEVIEQWMDVETTMNYLAVDRTIRHDDGPLHFYCGTRAGQGGNDGICGNHNYFWYENPTTEKLVLIPWDLDSAFSNILEPSNPITPIADAFGDITDSCAAFTPPGSWVPQRSAACDPLFEVWALMDDEYEAAVRRLHEGPLRAEVLDPLLDEWEAQIRASVNEAAATHDDALPVAWWQAALDELDEALVFTRENPVVPLG